MAKSIFVSLVSFALYSGALHAAEPASPIKATFLVTGLHCPPCTKTVATSLEGLPGLAAANVDWKTKAATVEFDPAATSVWQISERVAATPHMMGGLLSYAAWLAIKVPKLADEASAKAIKTALLKVKGVRDVAAYPKQHVVAIHFDRKHEVKLEEITTTLTDAGFPGETY
jgi:copper chaperone CopZ